MKRIIMLAFVAAVGLFAVNAWAIPTLTLSTDANLPPGTINHVLGTVVPDHPADPTDEVGYINALLGLSLGGSTTVDGQTIYRSQNSFSSLPVATVTGMLGTSNTTTFIDPGYYYLAVRYGGSGGKAQIWYLGDVAAGTQITVPSSFGGGISGWNFYDAVTITNTNPPPHVPDGGSTVALLGVAVAGVGFLRRKIQR